MNSALFVNEICIICGVGPFLGREPRYKIVSEVIREEAHG